MSEAYDNQLCEIVGAFYLKSKAGIVDEETLRLVSRWQRYLSNEHYECTDELLECLAKMYPSEEFRDKIDVFGKGTAEFMSKAIFEFLDKKKKLSELIRRVGDFYTYVG